MRFFSSPLQRGLLAGFAGFSLLAAGQPLSHAQRLSPDVVPQHYSLALTPNLKTATFAGQEKIDVELARPLDAITLNALEIHFLDASTQVDGKTLKAAVTLDEKKQQATLKFPHTLPAGRHTLEIRYTGILNGQLRGFYLSKTKKRNYAVTQFESTDARRAFPCFDEPADKATFDITLVVDKGDTAISNTNLLSDTPGPAASQHTLHFATTPKMSTYLVAFLVGDFQCVSGQSDGVPIRACATPDKVELGKFAVTSAEYILHYYNEYFGIKYPMPKLDMIALPDFEAGAMENFGAITYRETDLLLDEKTASVDARRNVALVVAHEMAHQWFGDMVTMQWWDNLWLNEGFATWMENKPLEQWKPEWKISEMVAAELDGTLNLDAQRTTRTIRAKADTPDDINQMFDGITYGKAGAVLLMVENYIGEETFRQGVHNYLAAHLYGNATAEDFWNAQTAVSHKPVDKIMSSLVAQPGEPILTFGEPQGNKVEVSQQRFFLSPKVDAKTSQTWTLPVCLKAGDGSGAPVCTVLSNAQQSLTLPQAPFLYANAGGKGYYRASYPDDAYQKLVSNVTSLHPEERISLLGDQWAKVRAEKATVGSYLDLVSAIRDDDSATVLGSAAGGIAAIDTRIATESEREALSAWVRKIFSPALQRLGAPSTSDTPERRELRAVLFTLLGSVGKDPQVIAEAKKMTGQYLENSSSVDATLAHAALRIAATNGDDALYQQLQTVSATSINPEIATGALYALARFRNPSIEKQTLDYAVSGKVRNQDSIALIGSMLSNRETQELAWQYVQQNWDKVKAQTTIGSGARLIGATGSFCTAERRDQVLGFFASHPLPATERSIDRTRNQINDCIDLQAGQQKNLRDWLAKQ
ncbi:MAG TPA: M1 family metallopeptidase [Acidisarcina sp.]|nr:M1 family metallopeptidase [Acidisarcina sp.]